MEIINLQTKSSVYAMYESSVELICDLLAAAVRHLPKSRGCDGLFALSTQPNSQKMLEPLRQISFETVSHYGKREYNPKDYDAPREFMGSDYSCREALEKAMTAAYTATCEFFPSDLITRVSAIRSLGKMDKFPLTTGYYVYRDGLRDDGPLVMVLKTSSGTFYAGFVANSFDHHSVQNAYHLSVYLFSTLAYILCLLNRGTDGLMDVGVAELLDLPPRRSEIFWPNKESGLTCFDESNRFFWTIRKSDKTLAPGFVDEIGRKWWLRILEHNSMMFRLLTD